MKRKIVFRIYKARDGFRWHVFSNNGKLTAESGESYKQRVSCKRSLASFLDHVIGGNYEIEKGDNGK
jgi:uncharacterized protein YegP (UPF0339 family)